MERISERQQAAEAERAALAPRLRPPALPLQLLTVAAAALVFGGFFLPWMDGAGPFGERSFSGFDFARLIRNFELATESASSAGQVRGAAVTLYLIPAAAVNAAVAHLFGSLLREHRAPAGWLALAAGVYALLMLALLLLLSVVPLNDFAPNVGRPSWGFGVSGLGAGLLVWCGTRELRR